MSLDDLGGVNHTDDLPLKLPSTIYPPQNRPILSKISDTQHHALLHKGLFCKRPTSFPRLRKQHKEDNNLFVLNVMCSFAEVTAVL